VVQRTPKQSSRNPVSKPRRKQRRSPSVSASEGRGAWPVLCSQSLPGVSPRLAARRSRSRTKPAGSQRQTRRRLPLLAPPTRGAAARPGLPRGPCDAARSRAPRTRMFVPAAEESWTRPLSTRVMPETEKARCPTHLLHPRRGRASLRPSARPSPSGVGLPRSPLRTASRRPQFTSCSFKYPATGLGVQKAG
jgi:hypothetical protein